MFLSRKVDPVVGKDGIEFGGLLWWNDALKRHTSVPPASQAKRPRLELRFDAAARSRGDLQDVLLVVLDEQGAVVERVRCRPRRKAQSPEARIDVRDAQARYERELVARRTRLERRAAVELAGGGAGPLLDTLAEARAKQGRPNDARTGSIPKAADAGPASPTPSTTSNVPPRPTHARKPRKTSQTSNTRTSSKRAGQGTSARAKGNAATRTAPSLGRTRDTKAGPPQRSTAASATRTRFNALETHLARIAARKSDKTS